MATLSSRWHSRRRPRWNSFRPGRARPGPRERNLGGPMVGDRSGDEREIYEQMMREKQQDRTS